MKVFNINVSYAWFKENLAIVILLPTVIGGIWQIIELLLIGTAYIRFFSISQLVPDGILISVVISLIVAICSKWFKGWQTSVESIIHKAEATETRTQISLVNKSGEESRSDETLEPLKENFFVRQNRSWFSKKRDGYIYLGLLLGVTIAITALIVPELLSPFLKKQPIPLIAFVGIFFLIGMYFGVFGICISTILDINKLRINFRNSLMRNLFEYASMFLAIGIFLFAIYIIQLFHRSFAMPDDMKNTTYLRCKVKSNNKNMKSYQVLYFNDKYIFVQINDSTPTVHVEVFRFEEFTNSENCAE